MSSQELRRIRFTCDKCKRKVACWRGEYSTKGPRKWKREERPYSCGTGYFDSGVDVIDVCDRCSAKKEAKK